jgi:hypothetical protein
MLLIRTFRRRCRRWKRRICSPATRSVHLTHPDHKELPDRLSNYGASSLLRRFQHLISTMPSTLIVEPLNWNGPIHILEKKTVSATLEMPWILGLSSLGISATPAVSLHLSNLEACMNSRFEHLGHLSGIDEAILIHRQAVALTPETHNQFPNRLSNLPEC